MAVARHKTVHAGARSIHISQTAMTQRILTLEDRLGITLFIRTRSGMKLTSEGIRLLRYCHTMLQLSEETVLDLLDAGTDSPLRIRIAGPTSIMSSRIIPRCMPVMNQFPHLYISFDVNDSDNLIDFLRNGINQFVIIEPEQIPSDVESKTLLPEKYLLVCTSSWKGRKLKDILRSERIIDFDEKDQMTHHYLRKFALLEYAQPERLFVNRTDSLLKLLMNGYGYGVLTKEFSEVYLESGDLMALNAGKSYDNTLALAWYARPDPPRYFSSIINVIS